MVVSSHGSSEAARPTTFLRPGLSLADGETLLDHFRSSLSNAQIEYIQKSLAEQKRGRRLDICFGCLSSSALAFAGRSRWSPMVQ